MPLALVGYTPTLLVLLLVSQLLVTLVANFQGTVTSPGWSPGPPTWYPHLASLPLVGRLPTWLEPLPGCDWWAQAALPSRRAAKAAQLERRHGSLPQGAEPALRFTRAALEDGSWLGHG